MKNVNKLLLFLLIVIAIFAVSCNSSKKSNCGCPNKQGMVGY
jgi:hypothetical protein